MTGRKYFDRNADHECPHTIVGLLTRGSVGNLRAVWTSLRCWGYDQVRLTTDTRDIRGQMRRWGWMLLVIMLVACGDTPSTTSPGAVGGLGPTLNVATAPPVATAISDPTKGTLTADPNPVPIGSGNGTTTIRWAAPPGMSVQIWVSVNGAAEMLFAEGSQGSQNAPWIEAGKIYRFGMYSEKTHTAPALQIVTVTR